VALAGALVHDPKLIILDEPLTGLDAGSARLVKNVLRERVAAGGTVIMTTHILEVAERMAAAPGGKAYGRLSVMLQWRYAIEVVLDVPPQAFEPPPKVESAVLHMTPKPAAPGVDATILSELVTVAFSQRRKLLRHTLGRWLEARAAKVDFDVQRRAEEVPVEDYLRLAASL